MKQVALAQLDNYRISELGEYLFGCPQRTTGIAEKPIHTLLAEDILWLVRQQNYIEIATVLAAKYFQKVGFHGYAFNYDDASITQRDLLKELVLLEEPFWQYNQRSYRIIRPFIEAYGAHLNLSKQLIEQFLQIGLQPIHWTEVEVECITSLVKADYMSAVLKAIYMAKRLKRAVDEGIEVYFTWRGHVHRIQSSEDILSLILSKAPHTEDWAKWINQEIRLTD